MKSKIKAFLFCIILLTVVLMGSVVCPFTASALDAVVKISQIGNTLNLVDDLLESGTAQTKAPVTAQIRAVLQGTDWIDPDRLIVIGIEFEGNQPISAILVPFLRPNANFQAMFNAKTGSDYYMISLPPGAPQIISESFEDTLVKESSAKSKTTIMAQIIVDRLLEKNRDRINTWLEKIETSTMQQSNNPMVPTPEDARAMISGMLDMASQLDTISFGIDLTQEQLAFTFSSQARAESDLAALFTRTATSSRLSTFKPNFQINFSSGPYDIAGFMKMLNNTFGSFYQKIGLDFSEIASICEPFSGEIAGGVSSDKTGFDFEIISVLKDGAQTASFLENIYLPWIEKYSRDLAVLMEQQSGRKPTDVFVRTADTMVAGCKVVGVKSKIPVFPALPQTPGVPAPDYPIMVYDTRMTTTNNLLLMASDDRRLEKLIGLTRTFKETTLNGPMMTIDVNLGTYLSALGEMLPDLNIPVSGSKQTIADLGKLAFTMNLENGRIDTVTSFKLEDIKVMITNFNKARAAPPAESKDKGRAQPGMKTESAGKVDQLPVKTRYAEKNPVYWSEKGELVAAYGNDKAAVEFFKEAIRLDPQRNDYYFNISVSYCELGEYAEALTSINKALAMDNENGAYYYTRGRIYLLSADKDKAMDDFIHSARLDHKDARDYLTNVAHVQWE